VFIFSKDRIKEKLKDETPYIRRYENGELLSICYSCYDLLITIHKIPLSKFKVNVSNKLNFEDLLNFEDDYTIIFQNQ
jgi:hypothetical protein